MGINGWMTTAEAAKYKGWSSANYVLRLIRQGRIEAKKVGSQWLISKEAMDNIKPANRPVGRPKKSNS